MRLLSWLFLKLPNWSFSPFSWPPHTFAHVHCTKCALWDFPGCLEIKTLPSNTGVAGSIPGQGAKIPDVLPPKNQNTEQKQNCNKVNKDFKSGHIKKNFFFNKIKVPWDKTGGEQGDW